MLTRWCGPPEWTSSNGNGPPSELRRASPCSRFAAAMRWNSAGLGGTPAVGLREAVALAWPAGAPRFGRPPPRCQRAPRVLPSHTPLRGRSLAQAVLVTVPQLRHSAAAPAVPWATALAAVPSAAVVVVVPPTPPLSFDPCGTRASYGACLAGGRGCLAGPARPPERLRTLVGQTRSETGVAGVQRAFAWPPPFGRRGPGTATTWPLPFGRGGSRTAAACHPPPG